MKNKFLTMLFILTCEKLLACGCSLSYFDEAVQNAEEIFVGKIYKIEYIYFYWNYPDGKEEASIRRVTFEVEKKWKGSNNKYVSVYDKLNSCSFNFQQVDKYIVYASKSNLYPYDDEYGRGYPNINGFNTDFCSRTLPDPRRYPWSENIIIDSFNDIPQLDQRFPNPIMLIDFQMLFSSIGAAFVCIFLILIFLKKKGILNLWRDQ